MPPALLAVTTPDIGGASNAIDGFILGPLIMAGRTGTSSTIQFGSGLL
jgi:hypothetical protein